MAKIRQMIFEGRVETGPAGRRRARRVNRMLPLAMLLAALGASPAWAGQWRQQEDGAWKYEEEGGYATGWIRADGIWYYLDPETGLWVERPELTETAACHLVENAVNRAGWYQNEAYPIHYKAQGSDRYKVTVTALLETAPDEVTSTLGTFEVNRRTGAAREVSTKLELDLYAY